MVGVPRSNGCLLCIKRRVKCDEARPGCGNCFRYGAECPGYDRALKFVAGKHQVRSRRPPEKSSLGSSSGSTTPPLAESSSSSDGDIARSILARHDAASPPAILSREYSPFAAGQEWQNNWPRLQSCPSGDRAQFVCTMIENLFAISQRSDIIFLVPWFGDIPSQIGRKVTLDSAVCALALHLLGKTIGSGRMIGESRMLYGQSLVALQQALNHPREWKSSETLCATMILSLYELFAGTKDAGSWMQHAKAVGWLIQKRGHNAYKNELDQSMFKSFRPLLIMHALFSGQDCFLAKKKWQKLLSELEQDDEKKLDPSLWAKKRVLNRYLALLAKVPGILKHAYPLREARKHGIYIDPAPVLALVAHTARTRADFLRFSEDLRENFPPPDEIPSEDPASPFPLVYQYQNVWFGSLYLGYWASMLILQECLNQCAYPAEIDLAEDNRKLASNILRSLEIVGRGVMGPFRIGYAMRIAYEFVDLLTQLWMKGLLERYGRMYASLSANSFPAVQGGSSAATPQPDSVVEEAPPSIFR